MIFTCQVFDIVGKKSIKYSSYERFIQRHIKPMSFLPDIVGVCVTIIKINQCGFSDANAMQVRSSDKFKLLTSTKPCQSSDV